jgi:hypothetical protein
MAAVVGPNGPETIHIIGHQNGIRLKYGWCCVGLPCLVGDSAVGQLCTQAGPVVPFQSSEWGELGTGVCMTETDATVMLSARWAQVRKCCYGTQCTAVTI